MTRPWQGSWQWVCVAEAAMACGYKHWLRAREPGVSMGTAGGCLGAARALPPRPQRRWELPLLGTRRYLGGTNSSSVQRERSPLSQTPERFRGAALNRESTRAATGRTRAQQRSEQPPSCAQSPKPAPMGSRARSSQLLAQSTAGL